MFFSSFLSFIKIEIIFLNKLLLLFLDTGILDSGTMLSTAAFSVFVSLSFSYKVSFSSVDISKLDFEANSSLSSRYLLIL